MNVDELNKPHVIRPYGPVDLSVDGGRSVAEVKDRLLLRIDPSSVGKAGAAYVDAAGALERFNEVVRSAAVEMAKVWEGPSSVKAQEALRTLHATIAELAKKARAFGAPLVPLGERLREHQEFVEGTSMAWSNNSRWTTYNDGWPGWYRTMHKGWEWGSQNELAGQHLRLLNDDLVKVYEQFPTSINKVLPPIRDPEYAPPQLDLGEDPDDYHVDPSVFTPPGGDWESPGIDGVGDPPSIDAGTPSPFDGAGSDGGFPDPSGTNGDAGSDGGDPGSTYPQGEYLSNDGSNGATPGGMDADGADPDLAGSGTAGMPDASGLNPSDSRTDLEDFQRPVTWDPSASASLPNAHVPNSTTGIGTGPGTGTGPGAGFGGNLMTTGPAGLPLNARSASSTGMPFLPMTGAGAGRNESEDKENSTWLHEDDDVWGTDTDGAVSDKIG